jgi:hypothetical protein
LTRPQCRRRNVGVAATKAAEEEEEEEERRKTCDGPELPRTYEGVAMEW